MSDSPLRRLRQDKGLQAAELALAAGVAPYRISQAERGVVPIPGQVVAVFGRMGEDCDALIRAQREWTKARAEEVIERATSMPAPASKVAVAGLQK